MRFRIQTDGEKFRVQRKVGRWWAEGAYIYGEFTGDKYYIQFNTYKQAVAWIRKHYGTAAEIVREWRTV